MLGALLEKCLLLTLFTRNDAIFSLAYSWHCFYKNSYFLKISKLKKHYKKYNVFGIETRSYYRLLILLLFLLLTLEPWYLHNNFIDIDLFKLLSNLLKQLHEVLKSLDLIQKLFIYTDNWYKHKAIACSYQIRVTFIKDWQISRDDLK